MLPIFLDVQTRFDAKQLGISGRAMKEILRAGHSAVGKHWHARMLRDHFRAGASGRYHYQPRKPGYRRRKVILARKGKAIAGGVIDLLLTGAFQTAITQYANIAAFPTRFAVKMHGPKYAHMRPFRSGRPNLGAEATALTDTQARELTKLLESKIQAGINGHLSNKGGATP